MSKLNLVTDVHEATARDYIGRMCLEKPIWMDLASQYNEHYWDGDRNYGYGGYKYIPGRWQSVAERIINQYDLNEDSKILDVGCGKGFLLYEIQLILPSVKLAGIDVSSYALENRHPELLGDFKVADASDKLDFENDEFDLVLSLGTLHNLQIQYLKTALSEIDRVGKRKYIMVESYRNHKELFNLQCWALTCKSFFSEADWVWLFEEFGYDGDYELIYFK